MERMERGISLEWGMSASMFFLSRLLADGVAYCILCLASSFSTMIGARTNTTPCGKRGSETLSTSVGILLETFVYLVSLRYLRSLATFPRPGPRYGGTFLGVTSRPIERRKVVCKYQQRVRVFSPLKPRETEIHHPTESLSAAFHKISK
jgi:hypothetical protein